MLRVECVGVRVQVHVCVCACSCVLRVCWGLCWGLAAHWVSMGAHTTALPVLISSRAGELWHQAGSLLEKRETYSKKKKSPLFAHFTKRHTVKRGLEFLCGPVAKPMRRKSRRVFIALVFCVDEAKINCSLENCFRVGPK